MAVAATYVPLGEYKLTGGPSYWGMSITNIPSTYSDLLVVCSADGGYEGGFYNNKNSNTDGTFNGSGIRAQMAGDGSSGGGGTGNASENLGYIQVGGGAGSSWELYIPEYAATTGFKHIIVRGGRGHVNTGVFYNAFSTTPAYNQFHIFYGYSNNNYSLTDANLGVYGILKA